MKYAEEYADVLSYIDTYWDKVIHSPTRRSINHSIITIPYEYVTPNHKKFNYIFYWDTFFMFRGLMGTKRDYILKTMIQNFAYLFQTYGLIPNFNSPAAMGRSQPPLFTSMIIDAYFSMVPYHTHTSTIRRQLHEVHYFNEKRWLQKMMSLAKQEYLLVWLDKDNAYNHHVTNHLLSRYGDRDVGYSHSSELESGWDFTSRFYNRCSDYLPVDLNALLYKYERDFAFTAKILGDTKDQHFWNIRAKERTDEINKLMWNEKKGFFFDYDYKRDEQSDFYSLAGYFPLWAGVASAEQAQKAALHLNRFLTQYGLTATEKESLPAKISLSRLPKKYRYAVEDLLKQKQWDYPNIWAPLEYMTAIGLIRYGLIDEAKKVMDTTVRAQAQIFRTHGTMLEKIDGITGDRTGSYHYELQPGFGWTNGVFYRFIQILDELEKGREVIEKDTGKGPPYTLTIVH